MMSRSSNPPSFRMGDSSTTSFSSRLRQSSEESLLSKSLNTSSNHNLMIIHRSASEIKSIVYSGYLLKRSNHPHRGEMRPFPSLSSNDDDDDNKNNNSDDNTTNRTTERVPSLQPRTTTGRTNNKEDGRSSAAVAADRESVPQQHDVASNEQQDDEQDSSTAVGDDHDHAPRMAALRVVSSFFGLGVPRSDHDLEPDENVETTVESDSRVLDAVNVTPAAPQILSPHRTAARSVPMSVRASSPPTPAASVPTPTWTVPPRRFTAPSRPTSLEIDFPEDCIDPKDGHIWCSKYCVLENGILYFYRNAADGDSPEAQMERQRTSMNSTLLEESETWVVGDLSRSPMARRKLSPVAARLVDSPSTATTSAQHASDTTTGVLWEKRVALNCVGAVRSAEQEYGECAFELVAVEDDEESSSKLPEWPTDKLLLRAQNSEDMNEWLFQFHRSLYLFMQNIVEACRSVDEKFGLESPSMLTAAGDIHYPLQMPLPYVPPPAANPELLQAFSPRVRKLSPSSLSHGHGRSTLHRRRDSFNRKDSDTTPTGASLHKGERELPNVDLDRPHISRVTPDTADRGEPEATTPIDKDMSPEMTSAPATFPETERPKPTRMTGKYIPPHLRKKAGGDILASGDSRLLSAHKRRQAGGGDTHISPFRSLQERATDAPSKTTEAYSPDHGVFEMSIDDTHVTPTTPSVRTGMSVPLTERVVPTDKRVPFKLGGCADPSVVVGSIVDPVFKSRSASKVGQVHTDGYGTRGGGMRSPLNVASSLQWEVGAVSQCGVPKKNQDSYLVAGDLLHAFDSLKTEESIESALWSNADGHQPGLFAVFDGHAGDQAARYAAERLPQFLYDESVDERNDLEGNVENVENVLRKAIANLDDAFCRLCTEDGRDWESGSTALVALVVHDHLVIANLGDCRGILCRSVSAVEKDRPQTFHMGWSKLDLDESERERKWVRATGDESFSDDDLMHVFYKEVTETHDPARDDEQQRILEAKGWITTEIEIPSGQLQRMDFCDEDVVEILKRCFSDRFHRSQTSTSPKRFNSAPHRILHISRICGELAVSRALGDRDFKSSFNDPSPSSSGENTESDEPLWDGPPFFPYPEDHMGRFKGDLISSIPDVQTLRIAEEGVSDEFLLLACDGLWDVMDPDDAIRVTRGLLYEKKWTAKEAAARLAQLGVHLGSSDNITVIVIRFFTGPPSQGRDKPDDL